MKKKVFLSYAREDYPFAHRFVASLHDYGVSGWMDAADVPAGMALASALREAISDASAMVVLISPESIRSNWVNFELGAGAALDIPIVPILIAGEAVDNELPEPIRGIKILDARNKSVEAVAQEVEKTLGNAVARAPTKI